MSRREALQIGPRRVVAVAHRLLGADGEELERSTAAAPLVYLHGAGQATRALEATLEGCEAGARFEREVPAGEWRVEGDASGCRAFPRDALPLDAAPEVGDVLALEEDGEVFSVWVTALRPNHLQVSLQPPWDGVLSLRGQVLRVRPATEHELRAGGAIRAEARAGAASASETAPSDASADVGGAADEGDADPSDAEAPEEE